MDFFAVTTRKRAVVDAESDCDGGGINRLCRDRVLNRKITDRIGHGRFGHTRKAYDIAGFRHVDRRLCKTAERQNFSHAELLNFSTIARQRFYCFTSAQRACLNAASQNTADERIGTQRGCQHAERLFTLLDLLGGRDVINDKLKQRIKVLTVALKAVVTPTVTARSVERWEIKLLVSCVKRSEQIKDFVKRAIRFRIRLINFVQNHDWLEPKRECFRGYKFCLGHRTLCGVHEQNNTVNHRQDPLYLGAEVRVTGGVNDVDAQTVPFNRCRFGENRNAALTLQIVAIHGAFGHCLVLAESTGLFEKFVNKGRFAVVNVGDDRNIAHIHWVFAYIEGRVVCAL